VLVVRDPAAIPAAIRGAAVTIGAYDGVHRGHRAVIAEVRRLAAARGVPSAVVTFDRHPAQVVRPASAPALLTDLEQKIELLATTGVDAVVVVPFDDERATESAEDFVAEVLVGALGTCVVVVGADFHFGKGRGGNVELLRRMGPVHGFEVVGFDLLGADDVALAAHKVSSTAVRELLRAGEVSEAAVLLGRPHEVRGIVVTGDQRGRQLGFPTANVKLPQEICLPSDGIYAGWYLRPDGSRHPAAINLGRRPTFYDDQPYSLLEAYLLDFDGDLYGEPARVQFVERLRAELRFDGIDTLIAQMHRDVARARVVLGC
jgi:riboflavin kinase/FMN adenylyltransferase